MKTKTVAFVTGYRPGGPYLWAERLTQAINSSKREWRAYHIKTLWGIVWIPFFVKADLVHTTLPLPFHWWRKPLVVTVKGDYTIEKVPGARWYPKAIAAASAVTTPSLYMKRHLGLSRALVIPNGANLPTETANPFTGGKKLRLLTISKFHFHDKALGVIEVARALKEVLVNKNIAFTWNVLGGGAHLEEIEEQVEKLGVTGTFHGHVNPKPFYKEADIFLYWSDHDNMPNVLIEASAYGLPVLSNGVGGVKEIILNKKTGYVARDMKEYCAKLALMINAPALSRQFGQNARERAEHYFNDEVIFNRYLDLYDTLT